MANSNCKQMREALSAYADGELRPDESRIIEGHLADCSRCAAVLKATIEVEQRLRQVCSEERAPDRLWERITASISDADAEDSTKDDLAAARGRRNQQGTDSGASNSSPGIGRRRVAAIAAGLVLALGAGVTIPYWRRMGGQNPLVIEPVNDFITFKMSERPLDMSASDPVKLKQWFNGKVDFRLPLDRAETDGFRLIGSRLCYFLNRRLSALMYERSGDRVSLYVMTSEGLEIPKGSWEPAASRIISSFQVKGYRNLIWQEGDLVYALVSDQPKDDMLRFVAGLNLETAAASSPTLDGRNRKASNRYPVHLTAKNGPNTVS